ncbi:DUF4132 domain-containing protein, partial [Streptomyces sp. NPDC059956]
MAAAPGEATWQLFDFEELGRTYYTYNGIWATRVREDLAAGRTIPPAAVATLRRSALMTYGNSEVRNAVGQLTGPALNVGEQWADAAMADGRWDPLLAHAATATAARPSTKWEETARALVADNGPGPDALREAVTGWFALVDRPRTLVLEESWRERGQLDAHNANALRGLAWLLALLPAHPGIPRALGGLVETCLKKVPGLGPRNPKVANAGVTALSRIEDEAALAELARLAARVTFKGTLKVIDTALTARAEALGLSREEIEELAVPTYGLGGAGSGGAGLTEVGRAEVSFGPATALLEVRGPKVALSWRNAAGKAVKSVPADVRRQHAQELGELKAAVKDIDKMLSAQAERLDRQFLARRTWTYRAWRERYLDHPLVGTLARRLVWTVDGTPVAFADGEVRTLTGDPVAEGTVVELWHPVGRGAAEVAAVRERLEGLGVTQPFKQAHREVYPLTEAERNTGTYSNR